MPPGALPTPVAALLNEVTSTLTLNFDTYPPHTIQRLAELVLRPRQHYRSLVAYLHALDRVVHVTSGANVYPLPPAIPDMSAMSLLANGVGGAGPGSSSTRSLSINAAATNNNIGSDEALGGALLTPIPWLARRANGGAGGGGGGGSSEDGSSDAGSASPLSSGSSGGGSTSSSQQQTQQRQSSAATGVGSASGGRKLEPQVRTESTETIEGPNGMGSIETVSISVNGIPSMGAGGAALAQRGVTQGELLRQEQRAGVVPLSQLARHGQAAQQHAQLAAASGSAAGVSGAAAADEDAAMSEGAADDVHDEDEEEEEEEVPHARGPEEIGAADTGPQPATTSNVFVAADGTVEMRGIDVEAAVGRRLHSPEPQQPQQGRSSSSPEAKVPRSPKREASDELESGASKKRVKEDGGSEDGENGEEASGRDGEEVKRDAEGDVVISEASSVIKAGNVKEDEDGDGEGDPAKAGDGGGDGAADLASVEKGASADEDKDMTGAGDSGGGNTRMGETETKEGAAAAAD